MKLYMHAAACSLSPHIVCRELDLPVDLVVVDRANHRTPDGVDFLAINGNGYVPILELEDGTRLMEGPVIVQYLADLRPEAGLIPEAGTMARLKVQSWLNFITSELHKPLGMMFKPDFAPARTAFVASVEKRLDWLAGALTGPYLVGESYSVADPYLFTCLNWTQWHRIDLARWPSLADFMRRVGARPKVRLAMAAEGLVASPGSDFHVTPFRAAAQ